MKRFWSIFRSILSNAVDTFTKSERSRIMAAVKSKDTTPELAVRRLVHAMGYRYRLHVHSLPGNPDLVFPRLRKVSNVNGCFWHLHGCPRCRILSSRRRYWVAKLGRNAARDKRTRRRAAARAAGGYWSSGSAKSLRRREDRLRARIAAFLDMDVKRPPRKKSC